MTREWGKTHLAVATLALAIGGGAGKLIWHAGDNNPQRIAQDLSGALNEITTDMDAIRLEFRAHSSLFGHAPMVERSEQILASIRQVSSDVDKLTNRIDHLVQILIEDRAARNNGRH